jgi:hypothetical protein
LLKPVPGAVSFLTEDDDLVLALVEIETETSFHFAAIARTIMSAGDVVDVDQKSATLRVGEVNEFHRLLHLAKEVVKD